MRLSERKGLKKVEIPPVKCFKCGVIKPRAEGMYLVGNECYECRNCLLASRGEVV